MPNSAPPKWRATDLVEAINCLLEKHGGTGWIHIGMVDGKVCAILGRGETPDHIPNGHVIHEDNIINGISHILQTTRYGIADLEIRNGHRHEASYKVTHRSRKRKN